MVASACEAYAYHVIGDPHFVWKIKNARRNDVAGIGDMTLARNVLDLAWIRGPECGPRSLICFHEALGDSLDNFVGKISSTIARFLSGSVAPFTNGAGTEKPIGPYLDAEGADLALNLAIDDALNCLVVLVLLRWVQDGVRRFRFPPESNHCENDSKIREPLICKLRPKITFLAVCVSNAVSWNSSRITLHYDSKAFRTAIIAFLDQKVACVVNADEVRVNAIGEEGLVVVGVLVKVVDDAPCGYIGTSKLY
eukprot:6175512-Pleurochrysis_carterae.AAC.2